MWSKWLFAIYRHAFGFFIYLGAKSQKVHPLQIPVDERIELIPFAHRKPYTRLPLLYDAKNFPAADLPGKRKRRIQMTRPLIGVLGKLKRPGIGPVPADHDEMIDIVYPYFFRKAWPHPPVVPPELAQSDDLLAELAVAGPFGDYVRRISTGTEERIEAIQQGLVTDDMYMIDLEELANHQVKPGLEQIGCTVVLAQDAPGTALATRAILYQGAVVTPGDEDWPRVERIARCSLATHGSAIKHTLLGHLAHVTPFVATTINTLGPDHPIRRLIHHCFQTALIGNYEVSQFQIRGKDALWVTIYSYDHEALLDFFNAELEAFDVADTDPEESERRRGVADATFPYPHRENVMPMWEIIKGYVATYIDLYYADDAAVAADGELVDWYAALDDRLPGGLKGYAPALDKDALRRLCASFIHASTVAHDNVNNIVWNYTTLPQYLPTVVPVDGSLPGADVVFDFLTTLIGTWKPFNMLLDGISQLAVDDAGRQVMDQFVADLEQLQVEMEAEPFSYQKVYPKNLNCSVSN